VSPTITSPEVVEQRVYTWAGDTNNSSSLERINGVATRRNWATRPLVEAGTNSGNRVTQARDTAWWVSDGASVALNPDGSGSSDSFLTLSFAGLTVGNRYTVSAFVQLPEAQTVFDVTRARRIVVYNAGEGTVMSDQLPNIRTRAANPSVTFTYAAGLLIRLYNGSSVPGELVRWDSPYITEEANVGTTYFSGNTQNRDFYAVTRPLATLGHDSAREARTVVHTVMGRAEPDVTLFPSNLRTGTLAMLFDDEALSLEAQRMHAQPYVFTMVDPDAPTTNMKYVTVGPVVRVLDEERTAWTVGVGYQEVS
jgi:hypothetical protein